jgi:hypothetical protein
LRGFLLCAVAQGKGLASSEADTLTTAPSSDAGSAISLSEYLESLKSGDTVLVGLVVSRDHLVPSGAQDLDRTAVDADVFVGHEALVEAHALGSCAGSAEASGQGLHFRAESLLEPQSVARRWATFSRTMRSRGRSMEFLCAMWWAQGLAAFRSLPRARAKPMVVPAAVLTAAESPLAERSAEEAEL